MPPIQYVTLVAEGGIPVRLANQDGTPFPTTGYGALVFARNPTLENPTLTNVEQQGPVAVPMGTLLAPSVRFGDATPQDGLYQPNPNQLAIGLNGVEVALFTWDDALRIRGDLTVEGALHADIPTVLTTAGDLIYYAPGLGESRLPKGAAGQILRSTSTSLEWATVGGTGTVTRIWATGEFLINGVQFGEITTTGEIALNATGVGAGTYGSATAIPVITVLASGRIAAAGQASINVPAILGYTPANVGLSLSQFAATTSAQLASIISDETGAAGGGSLVFNQSPVLLGMPTAPTPVAGVSNNQIATTAFVQATIGGPYLPIAGGTLTGQLNGTVAAFSSTVQGLGGYFTGNMITPVALMQAATFPQLRFNGTAHALDLKQWWMTGDTGGALAIQAINDAGNTVMGQVNINRNGTMNLSNSPPLNSNDGSVATTAWVNAKAGFLHAIRSTNLAIPTQNVEVDVGAVTIGIAGQTTSWLLFCSVGASNTAASQNYYVSNIYDNVVGALIANVILTTPTAVNNSWMSFWQLHTITGVRTVTLRTLNSSGNTGQILTGSGIYALRVA